MSDSIRNLLTIYGPVDEADRFIGKFLRGGLEAFVPIPNNCNVDETWGACQEYCDCDVLTATSVVLGHLAEGDRSYIDPRAVTHNWLNINRFTLAEHHETIPALDLPGFAGGNMTPRALFVFYTEEGFPDRWIESVINAEFECGVVLHMESYDYVDNCDCAALRSKYPGNGYRDDGCEHFHSYTSTGTEFIQSGHCAIQIRMEHGIPLTDDEMDNGDSAGDLCLPGVDDENNALLDISTTAATAQPVIQ